MEVSAELRRELRGEVKGLERLDAQAQQQLLALLREAHRRQKEDLEAALNGALSHIPALLRGAVRRIFFRT